LADLQFSGAVPDDRLKAMGALWRFLDRDGTGQIQPAIGTIVRFVNRYQCRRSHPSRLLSLATAGVGEAWQWLCEAIWESAFLLQP
jgi:hypothetical protein